MDDLLSSFRWYDALCINQEDSKEKGHQVALMPQIYTYSRSIGALGWKRMVVNYSRDC